jgi:hypothetical protein
MKKILILTTLALASYAYVFSQVRIKPELLSIAVLAQFKGSSGSGFYLRDSLDVYFVTAYHVIFNLQTSGLQDDTLSLISYRSKTESDNKTVLLLSLLQANRAGNIKYDRSYDIAAVKIAHVRPYDTLGNVEITYLPYAVKLTPSTRVNFWQGTDILKFADIDAGSDIYIIGYPKSLGLQGKFDLDRPLFRKGIVAGKDINYHRIIGDGAVYFGNSGGAVMELTYLPNGDPDIRLIGIVSEYIPFDDILFDVKGQIRSIDTKNSGYSVITPAERLLQLIHQ